MPVDEKPIAHNGDKHCRKHANDLRTISFFNNIIALQEDYQTLLQLNAVSFFLDSKHKYEEFD